MSFTALPDLTLPSRWSAESQRPTRTKTELQVSTAAGGVVTVVVERCGAGRLRDAYPVSTHDVEVQTQAAITPDELTSLLRDLVGAIEQQDPECRRVVYVAPEMDVTLIGSAESAGFRYVLDVDLPEGPVSLMVAEPTWVTKVDMDLDRVPQT